MMLSIQRFRVSVVQVATLLELMRHPPSSGAKDLRELASSMGYQHIFRRVGVAGSPDSKLGLSVPWNVPPEEAAFWSSYLDRENIRDVKEDRAWKSIVPLRRRLDDHLLRGIANSDLGNGITASRDPAVAYHYPHGLGIVVDFEVKGDLDLDGFVAAARRLRGIDPTNTNQYLPTNRFLYNHLAKLASELGIDPFEGDLVSDRFTVVTVIMGEVESDPTSVDQRLRKALLGLTDWRQHWQHSNATNTDWADALVPRQGEPPQNVELGATNGRVVWYPLDFVPPVAGPKTKLRDLHAELTLAAMQVESLAGLVRSSLPSRLNWSSLQESRVKAALRMLRALFHRARSLPSYSPRRHILDGGFAADLNAAEDHFGRAPSFR